MHTFITWHGYFMLNAALIIGYVLARIILNLPLFKLQFLQSQRLIFARYSFIAAIAAFYIGPVMMQLLPVTKDSNYRLEPIVKMASTSFMHTQNVVSAQITQMSAAYTLPSLSNIFLVFLMTGFGLHLVRYFYNIIKLNQIAQLSFRRHKIKNIHILFNHTTAIPFCWSLLNKHYVVIPSSFLEKHDDMKIAIRHELQHIRQFDTYWLHFLTVVKIFCFWNPVMKLWINWFDELQEFSCDETLMLRKKTSASAYAQCLVDAASGLFESRVLPQGALGIHGFSTSILYRRVNMLFDYTPLKQKKLPLIAAYAVTVAITAATSMAFAGSNALTPLSQQDVSSIITQLNLDQDFHVTATPEVVSELNKIRGSEHARSYLQASLQRMKQHQPLVEAALNERGMPNDLLVVALAESGYQPLPESANPVQAAGIWQIIPSTARKFGLTVNDSVDQRMDMRLATQAALKLLKADHDIYKNWKLAFVAYEIGEKKTDALIKATGSRDAWVLANSPQAPASLKKALATFDAELIIMHQPALID